MSFGYPRDFARSYLNLRREMGTILLRPYEHKGVDLLEGKACIDQIHMCFVIPPK